MGSSKGIRMLLTAVLLMISMPLFAQAKKTVLEKSFIAKKQKALPYKPLPMIDPVTKRKVAATTTLRVPAESITLPGAGKRKKVSSVRVQRPALSMRADKYYKELNALEQKFNAQGYTLKTPQNIGTLYTYEANYKKLENDKKVISAKFPKVTTKNRGLIPARDTLLAMKRNRMLMNPAADLTRWINEKNQKVPATPATVNATHAKSGDFELGDPSKLQVWFRNRINTSHSIEHAVIRGSSGIGATLWESQITLSQLTMRHELKRDESCEHEVKWEVLKIPSFSLQTLYVKPGNSDTLNDSARYSQNFYEQRFIFQAGPIPVEVTVGLKGEIGINVDSSLSLNSSYATVKPYTKCEVYAIGAVGISAIVAIGVGIDLTLCQFDFTLHSRVGVKENENPPNSDIAYKYLLDGEYQIKAGIEALSGEFFLYFSIVGISFNIGLFDWEGLRDEYYLVNESIPQPVYAWKRNADFRLMSVNWKAWSSGMKTPELMIVVRNGGGEFPADHARHWLTLGLTVTNWGTQPPEVFFPGQQPNTKEKIQAMLARAKSTWLPVSVYDTRKVLLALDGSGTRTFGLDVSDMDVPSEYIKLLQLPLAGKFKISAELNHGTAASVVEKVLKDPRKGAILQGFAYLGKTCHDVQNDNNRLDIFLERDSDLAVTGLRNNGGMVEFTISNLGNVGIWRDEVTDAVIEIKTGSKSLTMQLISVLVQGNKLFMKDNPRTYKLSSKQMALLGNPRSTNVTVTIKKGTGTFPDANTGNNSRTARI